MLLLVPAHLGSPGQMAIKCVVVVVVDRILSTPTTRLLTEVALVLVWKLSVIDTLVLHSPTLTLYEDSTPTFAPTKQYCCWSSK